MQLPLFEFKTHTPFKVQLLKWIGNKQRFAHEILGYFPQNHNTYYEPFLGSGAVLGTLAPQKAIASDGLQPLIEIWNTLKHDPATLQSWYQERWERYMSGDQSEVYSSIKASYNAQPNGADLLFISRSGYGGLIRFRKDGYISTARGIHAPITPAAFNHRVELWHGRIQGTTFIHRDFESVMDEAQAGDLIYCDPPYTHTQAIVYGAQSFSLDRLFETIARCKSRGVYVVLSIDGSKKTGRKDCFIPTPDGLFEHEADVNCGRSMLRRFQMGGQTLENEVVTDRLLLTF